MEEWKWYPGWKHSCCCISIFTVFSRPSKCYIKNPYCCGRMCVQQSYTFATNSRTPLQRNCWIISLSPGEIRWHDSTSKVENLKKQFVHSYSQGPIWYRIFEWRVLDFYCIYSSLVEGHRLSILILMSFIHVIRKECAHLHGRGNHIFCPSNR